MQYSWMLVLALTVVNLALIFYQLFKPAKRPSLVGEIVVIEGGSMYVELINEGSMQVLQDSDYVTFKVVKVKTQK